MSQLLHQIFIGKKVKKNKTLKKLPTNFKCVDIICDFCGFLAQVKTSTVKNINILPNTILGAGWKVQKERMNEKIYLLCHQKKQH